MGPRSPVGGPRRRRRQAAVRRLCSTTRPSRSWWSISRGCLRSWRRRSAACASPGVTPSGCARPPRCVCMTGACARRYRESAAGAQPPLAAAFKAAVYTKALCRLIEQGAVPLLRCAHDELRLARARVRARARACASEHSSRVLPGLYARSSRRRSCARLRFAPQSRTAARQRPQPRWAATAAVARAVSPWTTTWCSRMCPGAPRPRRAPPPPPPTRSARGQTTFGRPSRCSRRRRRRCCP